MGAFLTTGVMSEPLRFPVYSSHYLLSNETDTMKTKDLKDCRGRPIVVGAKVAYNQSGNVVPGEVTAIRGRFYQESWGPAWDGYFLVKNLLHPKDKASKVKRPESMMVIDLHF